MLRNSPTCKFLLQNINNQRRWINQHPSVLYNKSKTNVIRQGKIMGKLYGDRVAGSKKRWFPTTDGFNDAGVLFKQSQFGKPPSSGGKNAGRRMTVLNKLFMKHITDLMATGEISEAILGKGLQVSRVKISQDFTYISVYWLTTGETSNDALLEKELSRCTGLLRHELSQLGLMGVVPRIKFVKDKFLTNLGQVETLLKNVDFGVEESNENEIEDYPKHVTDLLKEEFYFSKVMQVTQPAKPEATLSDPTTENISADLKKLPEMRHDVLGLDHKGIMLKIFTKMRKSKHAWEQHQQLLNDGRHETEEQCPTLADNTMHLKKLNEKLANAAANSDKFEAFLAKRRERKNTPERKKYRAADHQIDFAARDDEYEDEVISSHHKQFYDAEDYLHEDISDKK